MVPWSRRDSKGRVEAEKCRSPGGREMHLICKLGKERSLTFICHTTNIIIDFFFFLTNIMNFCFSLCVSIEDQVVETRSGATGFVRAIPSVAAPSL